MTLAGGREWRGPLSRAVLTLSVSPQGLLAAGRSLAVSEGTVDRTVTFQLKNQKKDPFRHARDSGDSRVVQMADIKRLAGFAPRSDGHVNVISRKADIGFYFCCPETWQTVGTKHFM